MSLQLDARQRAMLAEMKLPLWWPQAAPCAPESTPADAPVLIARQDHPTRTTASFDAETSTPARPRPAPRPAAAPAPEPPPAPTLAAPPLSDDIAALDWPALHQAVAECRRCRLCETRRNTVFGAGPASASTPPAVDWLVVGEAPGENEDLQGEAFVGPAGQLLDAMLRAVGLSRSGTTETDAQPLRPAYIANVIKCRPPANRNPEPDEVLRCQPFLQRQITLLQPRLILALGRFAAYTLLADTVPQVHALPLGKLRGRVYRYQGLPVVVSYHPAYLLRNLPDKAKAWEDLCLALDTAAGKR